MISRSLSIAALSLLVVGGPSVACAAEEGEYAAHGCILQSMGECVRQVQSMLAERGYLRDYPEGEWDECSDLAADAFLSDKGNPALQEMPGFPELAAELEKTPADVRRNGKPVCHVQADSSNSKVLAWLKKNPIVNAAVAEAKKFSGAKTCDYDVKSSEDPQSRKGSTFDYSAEITCIDTEAAGIVRVKGSTSFSDYVENLTLSIEFVG